MNFKGFCGDFLHGHGGDFASVELVETELDFAFELLEFDFGEGIVVFLGGEDEGWTAVFRDGNGPREGAIQDLAELLFCGVGGDGFHGFSFV